MSGKFESNKKRKNSLREKWGCFREKYRFSLPGWAVLVFTVIYCEAFLHFWVTDAIQLGRLAVILCFSAGLGCLLGLITALFGAKAGKITTVVLSALVSVLVLTEFFLSDAYKNFMDLQTIFTGAGGVAADYSALVFSMLGRNLWRILLLLAPAIVFGILGTCKPVRWLGRGILAAACLGLYLLGFGAIHTLTQDASVLGRAYNFDTAVRCMGLNMALALDTKGLLFPSNAEPEFVQLEIPTTPPVVEESEPSPEEEEVVYGYNVFDLDYLKMAEEAKNSNLASLDRYVASLTPSRQNQYTGLFKGKNLILITAEAFSAEVIDPELTPTLYRMANEGIKFHEYYQPAWGASTTTGEFSNLFGIVPTNAGGSMGTVIYQPMLVSMGFRLKDEGYFSAAYHNHVESFYNRYTTHRRLGYDSFSARYGGLDEITGCWPESDLEMIDVTVPKYIDHQPFNIYYMTVSGHCLYSQTENAMTRKNWDKVQNVNHSDTVKAYLAANLELEYAMESLIRQLEEAGIADDTVIALATDHYPYGLERSSTWKNTRDHLAELYGVEDYDKFTRDHNALIIWSGCIEDMDLEITTPVYSLDILPTLCNLFGVNYDSRLIVGRDVFSDTEPLVLWPDHSWRTDKGTYDFKTKVFTPRDGVTVEDGYIERICALVDNKITYSKSVQDYYYFNHISKYLYPDLEKW